MIVCEGEKTEPEYFQAFPVRGVEVTVEGLGDNTLSLVTRAIEMHEDGDYDETWVVFDRDSFPPERFRASIDKATAAGLRVAYTNEAFEAWYLMHFHYCDSALSRETYSGRLTDALGRPYRKRDPGMYWAVLSRQPDAIRHANNLLDHHGPGHDPEAANPSTTVHLLVQRLNELR
ncbi:MAG: RloB domain-containing protein [Myxococcales bacterium]|nr:RloB domain-containing protein [Myxococcales bacterium]